MADGKLTALGAKREKKPGFHNDGAGLYLRIEGGRRLWMFRFAWGGKQHWHSLGPDRDITLAEAREAARQCRRMVREGVNPIEARKAAKLARMADIGRTFRDAADHYIAAHKAGWRNEKHGAQWEATLKAYAYRVIGMKPVQAITTADILLILEAIWNEKPETASRVRGRIEAVLDYATARHWRQGENPARWKGHLDKLLAPRAKVARVEHHPALPWQKLPLVMGRLAASEGMGALCLRFLVLTAARSSEARGARWNEIDLAAQTWTIPGERMKAGKAHRVALSDAALDIVHDLQPLARAADGLVFPGGRIGSPLSDVALSKALRAAGGDGVTVHGMRSAFRQWVSEATNYAGEIAELALAHVNKDRIEAAYQRSDLYEKRRQMMAQWAEHCIRPALAGEVVRIGKARA